MYQDKIFKILKNIKLEYDVEKSFKIMNNRIFTNRYLIGISQNKISEYQRNYICKEMNMPEKQLKIFLENVSDANMLLLGFEENENSCIYKVYLEFWDKLKNKLYQKPNKINPELLYLGFKWNSIDNVKNTISTYICYPLLPIRGILKRLSYIYHCNENKTSFDIVKDIIKIANKRIVNNSFIYLEVSEEKNPRKSFDINIYKANLQLKDIHPCLLKLFRYYSISYEDFNLLYQQIYDKKLGHLSGGVDREGRDFVTIYYEV